MRSFVCLLAATAIGCGGATTTGRPDGKRLTAEQAAAWAKVRRAGPKGALYIAAWGRAGDKRPGWSILCAQGWMPAELVPAGIYPRPLVDPEEFAQEFAAKPSVEAVVILDLYSQESPGAFKWYHDNGDGVREFRHPPTRELFQSLCEFLYQLQIHPG